MSVVSLISFLGCSCFTHIRNEGRSLKKTCFQFSVDHSPLNRHHKKSLVARSITTQESTLDSGLCENVSSGTIFFPRWLRLHGLFRLLGLLDLHDPVHRSLGEWGRILVVATPTINPVGGKRRRRIGWVPRRRTPDVEGFRRPGATSSFVVSFGTGLCSSRSNASDFHVSKLSAIVCPLVRSFMRFVFSFQQWTVRLTTTV